MSKNKLKKFADMERLPNVFQVTYHELFEEGKPFGLKGNWHKDYFKNENPIVLELGCGKGEYAVGLAKQFPEKNFIGIDIKGARMWTGATQAHEENLSNVAFIRMGINMINQCFAENEVSEMWITFADPQMKKTNKRLTSTAFMRLYRQVLKNKGLIHLKSDSNFLFTYTAAMAEHNGLPVLIKTDNLYCDVTNNPVLNIKTYYEAQWIARGLDIKYLQFQLLKDVELSEPDIEIPLDEYRSFGRQKRSELKLTK